MHLRVISPSETTEQVLSYLVAEPAVANLVVHRGAAVDPAGDVVIADVARESANEVLRELKAMGLDRNGSIALDAVGVALSSRGSEAEKAAPGAGDDAVVWEEIEQRTGEESRLSVTFLLFLSIATVIAGIGVLLDQPILIVGAMVVGPEFGPLAALSVGVIRRRPRVIGRSLLALTVGFAVAIVVTVLSTLALNAGGLVTREMLLGARPLTDFIWRPDALSWVIAFLAGIAGILSLTTAKSGALIGVLISVTTVPAAGNVAVAIAYGVPDEAWGSALQLGINLGAIATAGILTLAVQRWLSRRRRPAARA
ncbi:MAG TPA: DUF389 domain-containing protein [Rhodoglobus sp.]|jgi:uncharacterized hydrophobic protein (TIGR00271 family)|nr:DUF389 domain-containing protein [Rhodoglobus sp.]